MDDTDRGHRTVISWARKRLFRALAPLLVLVATGCKGGDAVPAGSASDSRGLSARELTRVALPDLSHTEPSVRNQLQTRHSLLERARTNPATTPSDLSNQFGEMGRLFLAAELPLAAEPCLVNAEILAPREMRWPYYLGHIYRMSGQPERAGSAFERALNLQPSDIPSLIWSGRLYLDLGRPELAETYFSKALAAGPGTSAAQFGLGRAALEQKDYARAIRELEATLATAPEASAVHYPLAMAYRGAGDHARADAHMQQRGNLDVPLRDPLIEEVGVLLESPLAYQRRGLNAMDRGNWVEAVAHFRKGLELGPAVPSLRDSLSNKLGAALFQMGDAPGARRQFEQGTRESPHYAANQVSLGIVLSLEGRDVEAVRWLRAAVRADPSYLEGRLQLADALRRTGMVAESLQHYDEVIRLDPRMSDASFGCAMALVRLGRYRKAMARLTEGRERHPGERRFTHAMARLLASAPDAAVRDGKQALALTQELQATGVSIDLAETIAMASAEVGRFKEAADWQRQVIATVRENAGDPRRVEALLATLARYERGEPSRTPWSDEDPIHFPLPALR
jgi:tetratricopeptide (TPR) repeat protein